MYICVDPREMIRREENVYNKRAAARPNVGLPPDGKEKRATA